MTTMMICPECYDAFRNGVELEERCLGHWGLYHCDECGKEIHLYGLDKRNDEYHQPSQSTWERVKAATTGAQ